MALVWIRSGNSIICETDTRWRWSASGRAADISRLARDCGLFVTMAIPASRTESGQIEDMAFA